MYYRGIMCDLAFVILGIKTQRESPEQICQIKTLMLSWKSHSHELWPNTIYCQFDIVTHKMFYLVTFYELLIPLPNSILR